MHSHGEQVALGASNEGRGMDGTRLVGRDPELALLREQLDRARRGEARVVFVRGEAGIGKTSLVHSALGDLDGFRVLAASGEETERDLAFGVIQQLMTALGSEAPVIGTSMSVGSTLLGALSDAQSSGPLVLWVDDLHWVDPPSQEALYFAVRRLRADDVCIVLTERPDEPGLLPAFNRLRRDARTVLMSLGGLDTASVGDLAAALGIRLPPGAAGRLTDHTGGNPLWSIALMREVPAEQLSDPSPRLPAPKEFELLVGERLARISPDARRLVEASAVSGTEWPLSALARAASVADEESALAEAVEAVLLRESGSGPTQVRPVHALVSSAVVSRLDPNRRRTLHGSLAELSANDRERLRHQIEAATGYDDGLAERLAAMAAGYLSHGGWSDGAALLASAAALASNPSRRAALVDDALAACLMSGDVRRARSIAADLHDLPPSPRRPALLGWIAVSDGRFDDAEPLFRDAIRAARDAGLSSVEAEASRHLARLLVIDGRPGEAVEYARTALRVEPSTSMGGGMARAILVTALSLTGRLDEAEAAAEIHGRPSPHQMIVAVCRGGTARTYAGDYVGAEEDLRAAIEASRSMGVSDFLSAAWSNLAQVQYLTGRWDASIQNSEPAVELVLDTEQTWAAAPVHALAAMVPARRGEWERAARHVDRALAAARAGGDAMSTGYAATAAAVLAHSRQSYREVLQAVGLIQSLRHGGGPDQPGALEWPQLYAEALVRLGRHDDADQFLTRFESAAAVTGGPWARAGLARARALLLAESGHLDEAVSSFAIAEQLAADAGTPFDLALVRLQLGTCLRRAGTRERAERVLMAATAGFRELGALPFLDMTSEEIALLGGRPPPAAEIGRPALTPQEVAVSRLVRKGLSNREIATELFLSTKTVEFHLRHVFIKLGITSRTQLVARSAEILELRTVEDGSERPLRAVQDE